MSTEPGVVVVGAGAAGLSVAEALRGAGHTGPVTIVGNEAGPPYDRPPLSKQVLSGAWAPDRATLMAPSRLTALQASFLLGVTATGLDPSARTVALSDGRELPYTDAVIATGVRPRELPHPDLDNVVVLRTMEHALRLQALIRPGTRVVVVGGGFLGLEVAATIRGLGAHVVVVEPVPGPPLANRLGAAAAARLREVHTAAGIDILTGTGVVQLAGAEPGPSSPYTGSAGEPGAAVPVRTVELTDGTALPADVVVVAIGSDPAVEWLAGSGLQLDDGLVCDEYCQAGPGVWAAGDVARWRHPLVGRHVRLEHRTNASEQGRAVAANLLGAHVPFAPVPFFWTDHFDTKIQVAGFIPPDADVEIVEGEFDGPSFVQTFTQNGHLVGVLAWNAARRMTAYRRQMTAAPSSAL